MNLADKANKYIDEYKPWQLIKTDENRKEVQKICTIGLNLFRLLMIYLKPILPSISQKTETFLNTSPFVWEDHKTILVNHKINEFKPLIKRMEIADIEALKKSAQEI